MGKGKIDWKNIGRTCLVVAKGAAKIGIGYCCCWAMYYGFSDFLCMNLDIKWRAASNIGCLLMIIVVCFLLLHIKGCFSNYDRTISELNEEIRRLEKSLNSAESSKEWVCKLYEDLLKKHEMLLGKYNPPPRWWESEDGDQENKEETNDTNSTLH